jgi:hypothetical protein
MGAAGEGEEVGGGMDPSWTRGVCQICWPMLANAPRFVIIGCIVGCLGGGGVGRGGGCVDPLGEGGRTYPLADVLLIFQPLLVFQSVLLLQRRLDLVQRRKSQPANPKRY